jgi:hypothetical protein
MLTHDLEAGVRMLRSDATPSPQRNITMTKNKTRATPTGTAGPLPLRRRQAAFRVPSLRLIKV